MHTIALPDRTIDTIANRRSITFRWERPDAPTFDGEEGMVRIVELHVAHDKDRKEYHAGLSISDLGPVFQSTQIRRGAYMTIARERTARYSAKALREFATQTLTIVLPERVAMDESAATLFSGHLFA